MRVGRGATGDIRLASSSTGTGGSGRSSAELQLFSSSCSRSRTWAMLVRAECGSEDSGTSAHDRVNNAHNASENPTGGRSGRSPLNTFLTTRSSPWVCSKGFLPVTTCKRKYKFYNRRNRRSEAKRTSRIVIPSAYMSVLFDGNFLRACPTYPYLSGSRISGAIHRIVPPAL